MGRKVGQQGRAIPLPVLLLALVGALALLYNYFISSPVNMQVHHHAATVVYQYIEGRGGILNEATSINIPVGRTIESSLTSPEGKKWNFSVTIEPTAGEGDIYLAVFKEGKWRGKFIPLVRVISRNGNIATIALIEYAGDALDLPGGLPN